MAFGRPHSSESHPSAQAGAADEDSDLDLEQDVDHDNDPDHDPGAELFQEGAHTLRNSRRRPSNRGSVGRTPAAAAQATGGCRASAGPAAGVCPRQG